MIKNFTLIVAAILICNISSARIFRVGYGGIALSGVDFATVNAAVNAATAGDTIQIYGDVGGSQQTINKRLVILGFGYNLDVHPGLQAIGADFPSGVSLNFVSGSDGSIVSGVSGRFDVNGSGTPFISNIIFQRCYGVFYLRNSFNNSQISNIKILSSVITSPSGITDNAGNAYPVSNLQVFNCYILSFTLFKSGTNAVFVNCVGPSGTAAISPNDATVLIRNSIFHNINGALTNTVLENNFFAVSQPSPLPTGTNNRWGQSFANLFQRINTNDNASQLNSVEFDENYFILKPGSPAINGGIDGNGNPTDCGIFGGEPSFVYKPSGVPAIPAIYKLTAPVLNASSNPYNVTISVKSNN